MKSNKLPILPEFNDQLQSLAYKYYYNFSPYKVISTIFSVRDLKLLRDFGRNTNIVVCKPDKGTGVVVVDKDRYVDSIQTIISDQSKFQEIILPIQKYVTKIEDKINNFFVN